MYKKVIIVFLIVVAIILTGCNFDGEKSEKLTVAVTDYAAAGVCTGCMRRQG